MMFEGYLGVVMMIGGIVAGKGWVFVEAGVAKGCHSLLACNGMGWLRGWVVSLCN